MSSDGVELRFAARARRVWLRELTGADELSVGEASTAAALELLDRLLARWEPQPAEPACAADLAAADRDRVLVALYRRAFGDRIESTLHCVRCGNLFDLSFQLSELCASLEGESARAGARRLEDGSFETPEGIRFRLPTGHEELEAAALPEEEGKKLLAGRCLLAGEAPEDIEVLLEAAAPVVDLDLDARCPECGCHQNVHFDIQSYLLRALLKERRRLYGEVHRLAVAYGWSRDHTLALPRSERRAYVELVEAEASRRQRVPA